MTAFHDIYVISDLHLGGARATKGPGGDRGFQIFTQPDLLASFLAVLAAKPLRADSITELVINGDFVDFLAECHDGKTPWKPFIAAPDTAVAMLRRIHRNYRQVFRGLRQLIEAGHRLTLLLGNHDIELSFPAVRDYLAFMLRARAGSCRFIYDGEAYSVGSLIIEHGNRYDGFNTIDHDGLRRTRSAQSRRQSLTGWRAFAPPAGSDMVARVMNPLKERFRFVDLLKPETEAVIPLLLALDPSCKAKLGLVLKLAAKAQLHAPASPLEPRMRGDMAASGAPAPDAALEASLAQTLGTGEAARAFVATLDATQPIRGDTSARSRYHLLYSTGEKQLEALWDALQVLRSDRDFDRATETGRPYLNAAQALARNGYQCIVFGHTHLAKDIPLAGGARYLNSGSWADLMKFPENILGLPKAEGLPKIQDLLKRLAENDIAEFVVRYPTFAHVRLAATGDVLKSALCDYDGQAGSVP